MSITNVLLIYSLLVGIFSIVLFIFGILEKNKRKSKNWFLWGVFFLIAFFASTEYALWLEGIWLFSLTFSSFPLLFYFFVWFAFIVWIFEKRGERKIWIILLILLISVILISVKCPNCIKF
jgi:drug/metabolite transporter (DMT)-like permease